MADFEAVKPVPQGGDSKIRAMKEVAASYLDRYDGFEYRAMTLANADLNKYRYIMDNYSILEITELYYFSVVKEILNG